MKWKSLMFLMAAVSLATWKVAPAGDAVKDAVVKIETRRSLPSFFSPWTRRPKRGGGSGVVIEGGKILTCAHVVNYATQILVQPNDSADKLPAKIVALACGMDLAVLELEDAEHPQLKKVLGFAGRQLTQSGENIDRLMRLWERRRDVACDDARRHQKEMTALAWWFEHRTLAGDWLVNELSIILDISSEQAERDRMVAERLAELSPTHPREAVECLGRMVEGDRTGWGLLGWKSHAQAILRMEMEPPGAEVRQRAADITNECGRRGHVDFRTLLDS